MREDDAVDYIGMEWEITPAGIGYLKTARPNKFGWDLSDYVLQHIKVENGSISGLELLGQFRNAPLMGLHLGMSLKRLEGLGRIRRVSEY